MRETGRAIGGVWLILALTGSGCGKSAVEQGGRERIVASGNEIRIASQAGGQEAENGWIYIKGVSDPEWSPDGRFIAFTKDLGKYMGESIPPHGKCEIWIASEDSTEVKRLAEGMKLFWEYPAKLTYCYWTPHKGNPAMATHFARIHAASGRIEQLPEKPNIPVLAFRWNGVVYRILDTKEHAHQMGDVELERFVGAVFDKYSDVGYFDFHGNVFLYSHFRQTDDWQSMDIVYRFAEEPATPIMLVQDGSEPCLSPDGRRLAFIRDGDLWLKRLAKPVPLGDVDTGQAPKRGGGGGQ